MPQPRYREPSSPCQANLFRINKSKAERMPAEFAFPGGRMMIHPDGDRLIIEPLQRTDLLEVLAGPDPHEPEDRFPDVDDTLLPAKAIELRAGTKCWTPGSCPNFPAIRMASLPAAFRKLDRTPCAFCIITARRVALWLRQERTPGAECSDRSNPGTHASACAGSAVRGWMRRDPGWPGSCRHANWPKRSADRSSCLRGRGSAGGCQIP